jgi:hypothetical protein
MEYKGLVNVYCSKRVFLGTAKIISHNESSFNCHGDNFETEDYFHLLWEQKLETAKNVKTLHTFQETLFQESFFAWLKINCSFADISNTVSPPKKKRERPPKLKPIVEKETNERISMSMDSYLSFIDSLYKKKKN